MFRERTTKDEIKVSHALSARINIKRLRRYQVMMKITASQS
jgi:hypothetical protein